MGRQKEQIIQKIGTSPGRRAKFHAALFDISTQRQDKSNDINWGYGVFKYNTREPTLPGGMSILYHDSSFFCASQYTRTVGNHLEIRPIRGIVTSAQDMYL